MNRKGQDNSILGFVLGGGVFIVMVFSGVFIISAAATENPDVVNDSSLSAFNNTFNKYVEYNQQMEALQAQTKSLDASGGGVFGFINDLINQSWNVMRGLWTTFGFLLDAIRGMTAWLPIPQFIAILLISMISGVFIFKLLAIIFNRDV